MNKPKIRHCKNCAWHRLNYIGKNTSENYTDCRVKYKDIRVERLTALLCKHYCETKEEYK